MSENDYRIYFYIIDKMTTRIFFKNDTQYRFELYDIDGNHYGTIRANGFYSLALPYSQSFEKNYNLIGQPNSNIIISFTIDINGFVDHLSSNSIAFVGFKTNENFFGL